MSEIEKRARELLLAEFGENNIRNLRGCTFRDVNALDGAMRAVIAALTPPEGYALVPVEPTEAMQRVGAAVACTDVIEIQQMWSAMLAARPEVKCPLSHG